MLASAGSSPPRDASPAPLSSYSISQLLTKKRKHAALCASSPAPSDSATPSNATENVVLAARHDLSARPRLTISRVPVLVPTPEDPDFHTTEQTAFNRIGFRYIPAGLTPEGSASLCRTIESSPTNYRVSWEDRSPFVKVSADGLRLWGQNGFRSARCNAPLREGRWYMEIKIEHGGGEHWEDNTRREGSHVRLGWGRREAPLNGPVGLDGYSYGFRDKTGEKVTLSRLRPYGRPFASGDVIGMYISLPPLRKPNANDPHDPAHIKRERIPIDFKGQEYFECLEYPQSKEMNHLMDYLNKSSNAASVPPSSKKSATVKNVPERGRGGDKASVVSAPLRPIPTLPGSLISFFINGECQGIAFQDIYDYLQLPTTKLSRKEKEKKKTRDGTQEHKENPFDDGTLGYYPFISLFNGARVRINPGPDFDYPPPKDVDALLNGTNESSERTWRPICDRYPEYMAEQWALDARDEEDAKFEAAQKAANESLQAEKKAERDKKRQQAEARRKAKKAAASVTAEEEPQRESSVVTVDDDRFGPTVWSAPIAGITDQKYETGADIFSPAPTFTVNTYSPAPTFTSNGDVHGVQSDYNSECADGDMDEGFERNEISQNFTDFQ